MAYSNTGLRCLVNRIGASPALWIYKSADAHATVAGANYFSDGADFGLAANDVMIVVDTATPTCTIHNVAEVSSDGATLTAATLA